MSAKETRQKLSLCLPAATIKKADLGKLTVFQLPRNTAQNLLIGLHGEHEHKNSKPC